MSAIKCEQCGKRMVTQDIYEKHLAKTHGGNTTQNTSDVIATEEVKEEAPKSEVEVPSGYVIFESIDDRKLDVSINGNFWKGKAIKVPEFFAGEVESLLNLGKFYFKKWVS